MRGAGAQTVLMELSDLTSLSAGESVWIAPWVVHGTLNLSTAPARFQVTGQPGAMTGYFARGTGVSFKRSMLTG